MQLKVLVAAPFGTNTSVLRDVIRELGAEIADWGQDDCAELNNSHIWDSVNAVIAIPEKPSGAKDDLILVEIGIAIGRGLPLVILRGEELPNTEIGLTALEAYLARLNITNEEALRFHLSVFFGRVNRSLNAVSMRSDDDLFSAPEVDLKRFKAELDRVRSLAGRPPAFASAQYEQWVADLFRAGGAEIAIPDRERGFDLVLILPNQSHQYNPIVVEVKIATKLRDLMTAATGLQQVVLKERAGLGLLLYDESRISVAVQPAVTPMVVVMGMGELISAIERTGDLSRAIVNARNEAVHRL